MLIIIAGNFVLMTFLICLHDIWNGSGIGNGTTLTQKEIPVVPLNTLCLLMGLNYTVLPLQLQLCLVL